MSAARFPPSEARVSLTFHWFLPTNGDSRHVVGGGHGTPVTTTGGDRPPTVAYLSQIARAAEELGFVGAPEIPGAGAEGGGDERPGRRSDIERDGRVRTGHGGGALRRAGALPDPPRRGPRISGAVPSEAVHSVSSWWSAQT
ncbi:hypothetical protein SUDANB96_00274 [Streptomyces sp. enrichment culture]